MSLFTILFVLFLLQFKHWYIDFVNQSNDEVQHKGIYGNWIGMKHSVKHGLGTSAVFLLVMHPVSAIILGFLDFVLHYHIDWAKMNWGNRDITTPAFWAHLGLDQMAHQIVYLGLIFLAFV